jgi:hypothetical protein
LHEVHVVFLDVGVFHITNGAFDAVHVGSHTLIALATHR